MRTDSKPLNLMGQNKCVNFACLNLLIKGNRVSIERRFRIHFLALKWPLSESAY